MTPSEIQAFFEIIKTGSISTAAENLFVTQPALTRRIQTLETELGYTLFERKKGQKRIILTDKGKAFVSVAHRMEDLWQEALDIRQQEHTDLLKLSAINSVSSYILPEVFQNLSQEPMKIRISFHHCHSSEAYDYVANGMVDLALISDTRYYPNVETIPLFQEPMVLLANTSDTYPEIVSPDMLNPHNEIFLPWNPEFASWHDYWFGCTTQYHAFMDQMSLLEYFLSWKNTWAIAPLSVALPISKQPYISVHRLEAPPSDRIIYYIKKVNRKIPFAHTFFQDMKKQLETLPEVSFLMGFR